MASIDSIKASDGSGNASVATVQNTRSGGATTLIVDTVQGINTNFHATMGTPHTFTDPVTGETITIISEATAVDFKGHVDGSNLEIDTIAPGYTDGGSEVGDIIIIKPTTQGQDEVAEILEVAHDDDGKLKDDAPITGGNTLESLINGWLTAAESWAYSAWSATTRIAQITVPTDATTKYQAGDRIKFTQPTDGVKYGIAVKVEATLLHVFLPSGTDFDNEAITAPFFSRIKVPFGFDADPTKWELKSITTTSRNTNSSTLTSLTESLVIGIGSWHISLKGMIKFTNTSSSVQRFGMVTLSADGTTETDSDLNIGSGQDGVAANVGKFAEGYSQKTKLLTAETTMRLMGQTNSTSGAIAIGFATSPTVIRAVCAYL